MSCPYHHKRHNCQTKKEYCVWRTMLEKYSDDEQYCRMIHSFGEFMKNNGPTPKKYDSVVRLAEVYSKKHWPFDFLSVLRYLSQPPRDITVRLPCYMMGVELYKHTFVDHPLARLKLEDADVVAIAFTKNGCEKKMKVRDAIADPSVHIIMVELVKLLSITTYSLREMVPEKFIENNLLMLPSDKEFNSEDLLRVMVVMTRPGGIFDAHKDGFAAHTINYNIVGRKVWYIIPPDVPEDIVNNIRDCEHETVRQEAVLSVGGWFGVVDVNEGIRFPSDHWHQTRVISDQWAISISSWSINLSDLCEIYLKWGEREIDTDSQPINHKEDIIISIVTRMCEASRRSTLYRTKFLPFIVKWKIILGEKIDVSGLQHYERRKRKKGSDWESLLSKLL